MDSNDSHHGTQTAYLSHPRLRILHVTPFFEPATHYGGPVKQLALILPHLAKLNFDVRVITSDAGCRGQVKNEEWIERHGYSVWYAPIGRWGEIAPFFCSSMNRILPEATAWADVVHLCLSFTHPNILASNAAITNGRPYVYSPRGCLEANHLALRKTLKILWAKLWERHIVRSASAIHCLTDAEVKDCVAFGADQCRTVVVPNAVETPPKAATNLEIAKWLTRRNLPRGPMVLVLGRVQKIKRLDRLIEAWPSIRDEIPGAWLCIAGKDEGAADGWKTLATKRGVADCIYWLGHIDAREKHMALSNAHLLAMTSDAEGMPNAALESLSFGVPCVLTKGCRLPEVHEANAGYTTSSSPDNIATDIKRILLNPSLHSEMSNNARALRNKRFNPTVVAEALSFVYRNTFAGCANDADQ